MALDTRRHMLQFGGLKFRHMVRPKSARTLIGSMRFDQFIVYVHICVQYGPATGGKHCHTTDSSVQENYFIVKYKSCTRL